MTLPQGCIGLNTMRGTSKGTIVMVCIMFKQIEKSNLFFQWFVNHHETVKNIKEFIFSQK